MCQTVAHKREFSVLITGFTYPRTYLCEILPNHVKSVTLARKSSRLATFFKRCTTSTFVKHKPKQCILQTHTGDALDVTLCNLLKLRVLATLGLKDEFPVLRRRVSLGDWPSWVSHEVTARHVEVTQNRNPSFRLGAVLNFMRTSRMREHALHKSNRISEYPRRRNDKI